MTHTSPTGLLLVVVATTMTLFRSFGSPSSLSVHAFSVVTRRATPSTTTTSRLVRAMSTSNGGGGDMPYDDSKMPYYALGVNLAMQVGGQGNIKTLLNADELELVLAGFCDNLRGTGAARNERAVLQSYGPALNEILQDRSAQLMQRVQQEGQAFLQQFLNTHPQATQTAR